MSDLPVLLGEAPSKGGDRFHSFPLSGPPARVLCALAGIPPQDEGSTYGRWTWALYERFECRNLFERYAAATPWSVPAARSLAVDLMDELKSRSVVCLGWRVQAAVFDALGVDPSEKEHFYFWTTVSSTALRPDSWVRVAAIPHPSGLNRLLNDSDERRRAGEVLRDAAKLALTHPIR